MLKFWTAALILLVSTASFANSVETHPIPLKERLKWDMWVEGVPEFDLSAQASAKPLPEELDRVLTKLNL